LCITSFLLALFSIVSSTCLHSLFPLPAPCHCRSLSLLLLSAPNHAPYSHSLLPLLLSIAETAPCTPAPRSHTKLPAPLIPQFPVTASVAFAYAPVSALLLPLPLRNTLLLSKYKPVKLTFHCWRLDCKPPTDQFSMLELAQTYGLW
jgi:hypothetical protein